MLFMTHKRVEELNMDIEEKQIRGILKNLAKMDDNSITKWLTTPLPSLNLKTPREVIEAGNGATVVSTITKALRNGRPNHIPKRDNDGLVSTETEQETLDKEVEKTLNDEHETNNPV
jgi:hypothetical protein